MISHILLDAISPVFTVSDTFVIWVSGQPTDIPYPKYSENHSQKNTSKCFAIMVSMPNTINRNQNFTNAFPLKSADTFVSFITGRT